MANLLKLQCNFINGINKRLNNTALASLGIKIMNKPIYSDLLYTFRFAQLHSPKSIKIFNENKTTTS